MLSHQHIKVHDRKPRYQSTGMNLDKDSSKYIHSLSEALTCSWTIMILLLALIKSILTYQEQKILDILCVLNKSAIDPGSVRPYTSLETN